MSVGGGFIALFDVGIELASYIVTGVLGVFAIVLVLTLLYFLLTANSLSSFKKAVKTNRIQTNLKVAIPDEIIDELAKIIERGEMADEG